MENGLFIINSSSVTADEFSSFQAASRRVDVLNAATIADQRIDNFELDRLFDTNHNGQLTVADVLRFKRQVGHKNFETYTNLLLRYDYNAYLRCTDFFEGLDFRKILSEKLDGLIRLPVWNDRAFLSAALATDGEIFEWASKRLRSDRELAKQAILDFTPAIADVGNDLLHDKSFILEVAPLKPNILRYLPKEMTSDKDVVLTCVKGDGRMLEFASACLKFDRDVVLSAVCSDGLALAFAEQILKKDIHIAMAALVDNGLAYRFVDDSLKTNNVALNTAINQNPLAWLCVNPLPSDIAMDFFLDFAATHDIVVPEEALNLTLSELLGELRAITAYPERFGSLSTVLALWANRKRFDVGILDPRPTALLLYNKNDSNGAFISSELPDAFVDDGRFNVLYYEVATEDEIAKYLKSTSHNGQNPIHTLVFAGHGERFSINFGRELAREDTFEREKKNLDREDFFLGPFSKLARHLLPNGQVILYACTTGQGGAKRANLANAIAKRLPTTATIMTEQNAGNISEIQFTDDLKAIITWVGRPYETHGRKKSKTASATPPNSPNTAHTHPNKPDA